MYETLEAYQEGGLALLWGLIKQALLLARAKLSPVRAGEMAAAHLASQAGKEYVRLSEAIRFATDEASPDVRLYEWLISHEDIKSVLLDMSGSRTLLSDMQVDQEG